MDTPTRISTGGKALRIALAGALPLLAAVLLTLAFPESFRFAGRFVGVAVAAGIELAAVGLAFVLSAALSSLRARGRGRLATRWAYGLSRHPMFAWWIWSVLPSLALLCNSWLFIAAALAAYIASRRTAKAEDDGLWERFGRPFAIYEVRVRFSLPIPRLRPFSFRRYLKAAGVLAVLALFALGVELGAVRPVILRLGATRSEASAQMPGDGYVSKPRSAYTQAVSIGAPAEEVWKWLVQVGYRRAGWYNVDAINRLAAQDYFIDGRGSSTRIHPELQDLAVGDTIYLVPKVVSLRVVGLEPARLLAMAGDPEHPDAPSNASWTYLIAPQGPDRCRLVVRFRSSYPDGFVSVLANGIINQFGGAMLQQPAMLQGLKWRAEKNAGANPGAGR